jgi:hypothetical protein
MGADDDKAQQEERVLQWLKKRGYTEVAKHYEEEQQQPAGGKGGDDGGGAGAGGGQGQGQQLKRRVGEANQNALLFRSVQLVRARG